MTYNTCNNRVVLKTRHFAGLLRLFSLLLIALVLLVSSVATKPTFSRETQAQSSSRIAASYLQQINAETILFNQSNSDLNGRGVVIGIYDGGLNTQSELFDSDRNRIISQACINDDSAVIPCDYSSQEPAHIYCETLDTGCYHGNAVAFLAAGSTTEITLNNKTQSIGGIAPKASINYVRQAMDEKGTIKYKNFVAALNLYVEQVKTNSDAAPDVINLSLSFPRNSYKNCEVQNEVKDAIDYLVSKNVVIVAASGNQAEKNQISYPACMNDVIAVSSTTLSGGNESVSKFSNSSAEVDLVAPGDNVVGVLPKKAGFATISGTSFSAPLVSGAIALIKQSNPDLTSKEILTLIKANSSKVLDPANGLEFSRLDIESISNSIARPAPKAQPKTIIQAGDDVDTQNVATLESARHSLIEDPKEMNRTLASGMTEGISPKYAVLASIFAAFFFALSRLIYSSCKKKIGRNIANPL